MTKYSGAGDRRFGKRIVNGARRRRGDGWMGPQLAIDRRRERAFLPGRMARKKSKTYDGGRCASNPIPGARARVTHRSNPALTQPRTEGFKSTVKILRDFGA